LQDLGVIVGSTTTFNSTEFIAYFDLLAPLLVYARCMCWESLNELLVSSLLVSLGRSPRLGHLALTYKRRYVMLTAEHMAALAALPAVTLLDLSVCGIYPGMLQPLASEQCRIRRVKLKMKVSASPTVPAHL
jgi:hypothetical protein